MMFPTLPYNDDFLLIGLHSEFVDIFHDIHLKRSTKPINKSFQRRIASNFRSVASIMEVFNKKIFSSLSINAYFLKSVKSMLLILESLILITVFLSATYHFMIDRQSHNLEISKKYFNKVSTTDRSGDPYTVNYKKYRYRIQTLPHESINSIVSAIHIMLHGMYAVVGELSSNNETFCNLQKYPTLLEHIDTAPDSYFSMVLLSTNTFLWMTYIVLIRARLSLENLIAKQHSTYIHTTCLSKIMQDLSTHLTKYIDYRDLEIISKMLMQNDISPLIKKK